MRIRPKEMFKARSEAESRFTKVIDQYNEYVNGAVRDKSRWQIIALISLAALAFSIIGWVYVALNSGEHLVIVEVNELGRARFLGQVTGGAYWGGYTVQDYMIESVLRDFITFTRGVSLDQNLMADNITRAARYLSSDMRQRIINDMRDDDPFMYVGRIVRNVNIESSIKITGNTWQFDWFDVSRSMQGQEISSVRYRGMFTVDLQEPQSHEQRLSNPLGIFIVDYNIINVQEVYR